MRTVEVTPKKFNAHKICTSVTICSGTKRHTTNLCDVTVDIMTSVWRCF